MEREPIELEEARIQLKRFEESLRDPAGLPSTALEQVMEAFADAGVDDDREFEASKDQLFTEWGKRFVKSLSPWKLEMLKKELQKKTPEGS